jgi:hypothetical protein
MNWRYRGADCERAYRHLKQLGIIGSIPVKGISLPIPFSSSRSEYFFYLINLVRKKII